MVAAILGAAGVLIGLVIGNGFGFWAGRREELAKAILAAAALREELWRCREDPGRGSSALLEEWQTGRRWLILFLEAGGYEILARTITGPDAFDFDTLDRQLGLIHLILWEEHEAFILTSFWRLRGNPLPKTAQKILDPSAA
jgi:hypothetical protein